MSNKKPRIIVKDADKEPANDGSDDTVQGDAMDHFIIKDKTNPDAEKTIRKGRG